MCACLSITSAMYVHMGMINYYRFYWMMWSVQEMTPAYCIVHILRGASTIVLILRTQLSFALVTYFMSYSDHNYNDYVA